MYCCPLISRLAAIYKSAFVSGYSLKVDEACWICDREMRSYLYDASSFHSKTLNQEAAGWREEVAAVVPLLILPQSNLNFHIQRVLLLKYRLGMSHESRL